MKSGHKDVLAFFAIDGAGFDIFHATMNISRFLFILLNLHFDNPLTKQKRKDNDELESS